MSPPGRDYEIRVEPDPREADIATLASGLTAHALPFTGAPGFRTVAVFARDTDGTIVGGVAAQVNWNWLFLSLVWVAEPLRGTGLGHRLLDAIEEEGRRRGCTQAHLDTFSYQARPFYERHGYEVFGRLDDYPPGHSRFFMRKKL